MNTESVEKLATITSRLDNLESKMERNFQNIGTQLKEHTRALTFISQTLEKTDLMRDLDRSTTVAINKVVDTRTQYEKLREELYLNMNLDLSEENKRSFMGKEIDEFLTRMRLTFLKSRLNLADAAPSELINAITSKFPNVVTNFEKLDFKEKDIIKQINTLFTGNVYQGSYTQALIRNMYNVFLDWR